MKTIRVHISVMFEAARAAGIDRRFGTLPDRVGGFEQRVLSRAGAPDTNFALIPMRGDRWPDAVLLRCNQIAHETYRRAAGV